MLNIACDFERKLGVAYQPEKRNDIFVMRIAFEIKRKNMCKLQKKIIDFKRVYAIILYRVFLSRNGF